MCDLTGGWDLAKIEFSRAITDCTQNGRGQTEHKCLKLKGGVHSGGQRSSPEGRRSEKALMSPGGSQVSIVENKSFVIEQSAVAERQTEFGQTVRH